MSIPLFVQRNLLVLVIAIVVTLALTVRWGRIALWVAAAILAGAALAFGSVSIWWNGCRPLCGEGWDVPGAVMAAGVAGAAAFLSVQHVASRKVPIWLRGASAAVFLWMLLRANLSTWVS
jgi:hypothetical protein